jgi:hypothetical protein
MTMKRTTSAVYLGRRLSDKGTLFHAWDFDGIEGTRFFAKLKGSVIGGLYEVECDDKGSVYPATLSYVGRESEGIAANVEWEVADRLAVQRYNNARAEKAAARKQDTISELVAPLRELYLAQRNYADRNALRNLIIEELTK